MIKKILVVDDEPDICDYLKNFFTMKGFEVLIATGGEEAISIAEKEKPPVMLLDKRMKGVNGLEVLQRLKEMGSKTRVIIVSAVEDDETVAEAMKLGASDYVTKPLDLKYLNEIVVGKVSGLIEGVEGASGSISAEEGQISDIGRSIRALVHDVRNNMLSIVLMQAEGMSTDMTGYWTPDEKKRAVGKIISSANRAIKTLDTFIDQMGAFKPEAAGERRQDLERIISKINGVKVIIGKILERAEAVDRGSLTQDALKEITSHVYEAIAIFDGFREYYHK